jgi:hypothetical protein
VLEAQAAQAQRLEVRHRVAQAVLAETLTAAQAHQVVPLEVAAALMAAQAHQAETAEMSSQEMAVMPRVIQAAQEEIAATRYSPVVAEDQVLTVLKQVAKTLDKEQ